MPSSYATSLKYKRLLHHGDWEGRRNWWPRPSGRNWGQVWRQTTSGDPEWSKAKRLQLFPLRNLGPWCRVRPSLLRSWAEYLSYWTVNHAVTTTNEKDSLHYKVFVKIFARWQRSARAEDHQYGLPSLPTQPRKECKCRVHLPRVPRRHQLLTTMAAESHLVYVVSGDFQTVYLPSLSRLEHRCERQNPLRLNRQASSRLLHLHLPHRRLDWQRGATHYAQLWRRENQLDDVQREPVQHVDEVHGPERAPPLRSPDRQRAASHPQIWRLSQTSTTLPRWMKRPNQSNLCISWASN